MNDALTPTGHIGSERMLQVATTQTEHFDAIQLQHLRACKVCSEKFADIVFDHIHAKNSTNSHRIGIGN